MSAARARRGLLLAALAVQAAACEAPADGVLRIAFSFAPPPPSESRVIPTEAEAGVAAGALGRARGRCDCDVAARSVRCSFEGLPALHAASKQALTYELRFLLWYVPLPARFDARALDRDPGGRDPDAPPRPMAPPLPRATAGLVLPDPYGVAERTLTAPDLPIDQIAGGELFLLAPRPPGDPARFLALDGRVGNLVEAGAPATAPTAPVPGGHVH